MSKQVDFTNIWLPDADKIDEMKQQEEITMDYSPLTEEQKTALLNKVLEKIELLPPAKIEAADSRTSQAEQAVKVSKAAVLGNRTLKSKRLRLLCGILVAVLAMATISFAAVSTIIDPVFLTYLKPSYQEQIDALENSAILLGQDDSSNGYTIRARQAIGDKNTVYVLFDLIAEDGSVFEHPYYGFSSNLIDLKSKPSFPLQFFSNSGMGYSISQMEDENPEDNVRTFLLELNSSSSLINQKISLHLENICFYNEKEPYEEVLVSGKWDLDFSLDYKDTSVTTYPLKRIIFPGSDKSVLVTSLRVSPISVTLSAKGRGVSAHYSAQQPDPAQGEIKITLKDGTEVDSNLSGTTSNGFSLTKDQSFTRIIDLREIKSIRYMGVELWH